MTNIFEYEHGFIDVSEIKHAYIAAPPTSKIVHVLLEDKEFTLQFSSPDDAKMFVKNLLKHIREYRESISYV